MKKYLLAPMVVCFPLILQAQPDGWQQKNDLGWNSPNGPSNRCNGVALTIGNKAYYGTGNTGYLKSDFWQYDPITDSWSQKANFPGLPRENATAFSIGGKGYIGLGDDTLVGPQYYSSDFWEYDTTSNSWTQKHDIPGDARKGAPGFSIGNRGYICLGVGNNGWLTDLWEYDPSSDSWTAKANFTGGVREYACAFSINGKGYVGAGNDGNIPFMAFKKDFWQYDPIADTWTQKADIGGGVRSQATGFAIGNKGFICLGVDYLTNYKSDCWQYDPQSDIWTQQPDFPGLARCAASGFAIGNAGYIVGGYDQALLNDTWAFDTSSLSWSRKANFGSGSRLFAVGFGIGSKGYLGLGSNGGTIFYTDFWEYDDSTGTWTQKADFPAAPREDYFGLSIGNKGYVGFGDTAGSSLKDFWEFDPINNIWAQKADFGGGPRKNVIGFGIGNKGYIGFGQGNVDFWQYDPSGDSWTRKSDFPISTEVPKTSFVIGDKGYIGIGDATFRDIWQYNVTTDSWIQKNNFTGTGRFRNVAFGIGAHAYLGTGYQGGNYLDDFWEYDTTADTWSQKTSFPGGLRSDAVGFAIGNKGYIGTGTSSVVVFINTTHVSLVNDFWQYSPEIDVAAGTGDFVSSTCSSLSGPGFIWQTDNNNHLISGIDPNQNILGNTCWGIRNVPGNSRNTFGWFGNTQKQFGAFLSRNYVFSPSTQPDSNVTVRLYCSQAEINNFIDSFNHKYGTSYALHDIQILKYDGLNQDLDPSNNSDNSSDYTSITPDSIGFYGVVSEYRYFEFHVNSFSEFYITLTSPSAPLPLTLVDFTGVFNNGHVHLAWQTSQEHNTSRFDILRSTDNTNFVNIGSSPAGGNSSTPKHYSFDDLNVSDFAGNTIYYRLAEVDLDGQKEFSKVININVPSANNNITVIPNPVTSASLTVKIISSASIAKTSMTITDMLGRNILLKNISLHTGVNYIPLTVNQLPQGVYFIKVNADHRTLSAKFEMQ